jgi:ACT domain-containing protein
MNFPEERIRELAIEAVEKLGTGATPEAVTAYVESSLTGVALPSAPVEQQGRGERAILTSFGMNHPGVVATISALLGEKNCDILDLSQKIMQEFFTMIILIDLSNASISLKELQEEMNAIAGKLNVKVYLQHEDVFRQMHRI